MHDKTNLHIAFVVRIVALSMPSIGSIVITKLLFTCNFSNVIDTPVPEYIGTRLSYIR